MLNKELLAKVGLRQIGAAHGTGELHLTLGFIQRVASQELAHQIGQNVADWFTPRVHGRKFKVKSAVNAFHRHLVLIPTQETADELARLNQELAEHLDQTWQMHLNDKTQPEAFTPHISIKRGKQRRGSPKETTRLNALIKESQVVLIFEKGSYNLWSLKPRDKLVPAS